MLHLQHPLHPKLPASVTHDAQDARLVAALQALPHLGSLTLAACADITDRSLQVPTLLLVFPFHLTLGLRNWAVGRRGPAICHSRLTSQSLPQSVQVSQMRADMAPSQPQVLPLSLTHLHLSACERLTGDGLSRLTRLQRLRLSGCPAVTEPAVQVCPRP